MSETKILTGKVRLSYPKLFTAEQIQGQGDPKYTASFIIEPDDRFTLDKVEAAIDAAIALGKEKTWKGAKAALLTRDKLKLPLRDGDEKEDEAYNGRFFLNATSKSKPGVVDRDPRIALTEAEVYAGMYVRATLNFYPFDNNGSKGIAVGLNNIQFLEDGEPLSGGSAKPEDDFSTPWEDDLF